MGDRLTDSRTDHAQRDLLRLATAGSVDDGKSTLIGRMLYDTKSVLADQLSAVEAATAARGGGAVDLALLTDGLRAEREQGITIDVAYRYFATARRSFILADCPGHVQYTRNMVTGATTADAVIVLVDGRKGVLAPGADADVVVYDPAGRTSIGYGKTHHMNMDHSAWEGFEVAGHVDVVMSRGRVVVEDGTYHGSPGHGQFLRRGLSAYLR